MSSHHIWGTVVTTSAHPPAERNARHIRGQSVLDLDTFQKPFKCDFDSALSAREQTEDR